jgi:cobalt-zinc-cadmium efflux system protein
MSDETTTQRDRCGQDGGRGHARHDHGDHDHRHGGHRHDHGPGHGAPAVTDDSERRVFWVMVLTAGFMVVEVAGGIVSGSLALLADAGHMLTDCGALAFAWAAFRLGRRPADRERSYGYHRMPVLVAFANGLTLIFIALWIVVEAIERLGAPSEIRGETMLAVAVAGLVVNVAGFAILHRGDRANLNMRGAALHVLGDLLGSVATVAAAVVILWSGWRPIDPLLSILVALLVARSAWMLVAQSGHILLEGTPPDIDVAALRRAVRESAAEVDDVHHVHAWSLADDRRLVTMHVSVRRGSDHDATLATVKRVLRERFGLAHATIQIEWEDCPDDHGPSQAAAAGR